MEISSSDAAQGGMEGDGGADRHGKEHDDGEALLSKIVTLLRSVPISILRNIDAEDQEIAAKWVDVHFCDAGTLLMKQGIKSVSYNA